MLLFSVAEEELGTAAGLSLLQGDAVDRVCAEERSISTDSAVGRPSNSFCSIYWASADVGWASKLGCELETTPLSKSSVVPACKVYSAEHSDLTDSLYHSL